MVDNLFPSGPWTGYYNYRPGGKRHPMDLQLRFEAGSITGTGIDDVAPFLIRGKYDASNLECFWTKTYPGSHEVAYRGFREGKGIWGTWHIRSFNRGGFHIWPLGGEGVATETRTEAASDRVETPREGILVGTPGAPVPHHWAIRERWTTPWSSRVGCWAHNPSGARSGLKGAGYPTIWKQNLRK